ncbi:MAG TPA: nuclear transport factor 2 family protein [Bryobacteraceae bacterium]|jgi:ketosteroid isomerase-like protein|nr:nuclear transport factor 2 family protein [Bryobacteraceae bacterium]
MPIEENKTNNEAEIRELIDRFAKAFRAKDVNGVMSVFAPEIVSFDILPPLQAVGGDAFVKRWQEFFDSYQNPIHVEFPDVSITAGPNLDVPEGAVALIVCEFRDPSEACFTNAAPYFSGGYIGFSRD